MVSFLQKNPPKNLSIQKQNEIVTINLSTLLMVESWRCVFIYTSNLNANWIPDFCGNKLISSYFDFWMNTRFAWQHSTSPPFSGPWLGSVELILKKCRLKRSVFSILQASSWENKMVQQNTPVFQCVLSMSDAPLKGDEFSVPCRQRFLKLNPLATSTNQPPTHVGARFPIVQEAEHCVKKVPDQIFLSNLDSFRMRIDTNLWENNAYIDL